MPPAWGPSSSSLLGVGLLVGAAVVGGPAGGVFAITGGRVVFIVMLDGYRYLLFAHQQPRQVFIGDCWFLGVQGVLGVVLAVIGRAQQPHGR